MPKIKFRTVTLLGSFVVVGLLVGVSDGDRVLAQNGSGGKQTAAEMKSTEQQTRGQLLFVQRCSLCHLRRHMKEGSPPTVGPDLAGVFKTATPDDEKVLRGVILKGTPNMPGWQYSFDTKDMDDLIAYLKTM
jgi:mono/diheme cytochrome c family protein